MAIEIILSTLLSVAVTAFILGNLDKTRWFIYYALLRIYRFLTKHRFDLYDSNRKGDMFEIGRPRPIEWNLELPQRGDHIEMATDEVFCYGVNSKLEYFIVRVSQGSSQENEAWLYLKLANSKLYTLPQNATFRKNPDETRSFTAGGLKVQCLSPMRKWKIFFNGLLREMPQEKTEEMKLVHVRFTFIWTSSSNIYDHFRDPDASLFAKSLSAEKQNQFLIPYNRIQKLMNTYEQSGVLSGVVQLENEEEQEMILWGSRLRILAHMDWTEYKTTQHIFGTTKNGCVFHIENLTLPGLLRNFQHGYIVLSSGILHPISSCNITEKYPETGTKNFVLKFTAGGTFYKAEVELFERFANFTSSKGWDGRLSPQYMTFTMSKYTGSGIFISGKYKRWRTRKPTAVNLPIFKGLQESSPLVVKFIDPQCLLQDLTGGKGASLAKLTEISEMDKSFAVPRGIVTTTFAFKEFMNVGYLAEMVSSLEAATWGRVEGNRKELCERTVAAVVNSCIPDSVCHAVEKNLCQLFGSHVNKVKFAVRSSATGEDSDELSCAGQMETFLGVQGLKEILTAIKKCWASQFTFIATEYKRRNGQLILTPMAVVIQEMAACDVAGVMFTCDPVTSNPALITITANYGLGESVVAATADPDTVVVRRMTNNELSIVSTSVGSKKLKIVIDESGSGTKEEEVTAEDIKKCCLPEDKALLLAKIGIQVEENFSSPRDIEWGLSEDQVYLLQARPVTSVEVECEYELFHELDCILRREDEYVSNANTAEVLPGALSPLTISLVYPVLLGCYMETNWRKREGDKLPVSYYIAQVFPCFYNSVFLNIVDSAYRYSEKNDSSFATAFIIGLFGRDIGNEEIYRIAEERYPYSQSFISKWRQTLVQLMDMFISEQTVKKQIKKFSSYQIQTEKFETSAELLEEITKYLGKLPVGMQFHLKCTFGSSSWNVVLLSLLAKKRGGWTSETFSDLAYLLSKCSNVESADIPATLQDLAYDVVQNIDPAEFKAMSTEEALNWFQTTPYSSGAKFREFLNKHGHRCYKEFDLYSSAWEQDPTPLVEMLQNYVQAVKGTPDEKTENNIDEVLSKLDFPLDLKTKMLLKFIVPRCHKGIRFRENSKSLYIKIFHTLRRAFWHLANLMVKEGRIPEPSILFFITIDEIEQLLKTRSPRILAKAVRRQRIHPKLDSLRFPEISRGMPRPVNETPKPIENGSLIMKGIPVSQGVAKGHARVARSLKDAALIQAGEILIAYSTDIAWSPYFPMLAGVVTELGGLISHGAVVARECGLPCVVSVQGATAAFKSGDTVIIDGNKGILKRIDE